MRATQYEKVCYLTEQRDEPVYLVNLRTGLKGTTFGCTSAGETVQVRLDNGELDSWERAECEETIH
jgi:hypothetical protein